MKAMALLPKEVRITLPASCMLRGPARPQVLSLTPSAHCLPGTRTPGLRTRRVGRPNEAEQVVPGPSWTQRQSWAPPAGPCPSCPWVAPGDPPMSLCWLCCAAGHHRLQPGGGGAAGRGRSPQVQRHPEAAGQRGPPEPAGGGACAGRGAGGLRPRPPHPPTPAYWLLGLQPLAPKGIFNLVFNNSGFCFYFFHCVPLFAAQFLNELEGRG